MHCTEAAYIQYCGQIWRALKQVGELAVCRYWPIYNLMIWTSKVLYVTSPHTCTLWRLWIPNFPGRVCPLLPILLMLLIPQTWAPHFCRIFFTLGVLQYCTRAITYCVYNITLSFSFSTINIHTRMTHTDKKSLKFGNKVPYSGKLSRIGEWPFHGEHFVEWWVLS